MSKLDSSSQPSLSDSNELFKQNEPQIRQECEDDDGYDPWSDRCVETPLFEPDPWS